MTLTLTIYNCLSNSWKKVILCTLIGSARDFLKIPLATKVINIGFLFYLSFYNFFDC